MAALTWQNVNAPQLDMRDIRGTTNDIFSGLQGLLGKAQATDSANWDQVKTNNTNAFMDELHKPRSPEEMAALQKSGFLDQMRASFGAQADRTAMRAAEDTRGSVLQNRALTDIAYKNAAADAVAAPIIEAHKIAALKGDKAAMAAIEAANPGLRGMSGALDFGHTVERRGINEGQQDTTFGLKTALDNLTLTNAPKAFESKMLTEAAQRNASNAQAVSATSNAATEKLRAELLTSQVADAKETRDALKVQAAIKAKLTGTLFENGEATGKDMPLFIAALTNNKSIHDDEKAKLLGKVTEMINSEVPIEYMKDGKPHTAKVPLPRDKVLELLGGAYDGTLLSKWNNGPAATFEERMKDALQKVVKGDGKTTFDKAPAVDDYEALKVLRKQLIDTPVVATGKGEPKLPKSLGERAGRFHPH